MRQTGAILVACMAASVLSVGCGKKTAPATPAEQREKATAHAVEKFKQRLIDLEAEFPALAGVGSFEHSYLGFTFVNNAVEPRLHIAVSVQDVPRGSKPATEAVGEQEIAGTPFVTALQLQCSDPRLKQRIEEAYGLLREDLKRIEQ